MTDTDLTGTRVVLTAQRKAEEFARALERRGVAVLQAPTMSHVPHVDDPQLLRDTRALIAEPPDVLVVTTGVGLRGWLEAADVAGLGKRLRATLSEVRVIARGAKARGAAQGAGIAVAWTAESETVHEIRSRLLAEGVRGLRIAVQHHGGADGTDRVLAGAGAQLVPLVVYRWGPSPDPAAVDHAVGVLVRAEADCVAFTSAPAVHALFRAAEALGLGQRLEAVLRSGEVLGAAVGDTTAVPLRERGIDPLVPPRFRTGPLLRTITEALESRKPPTCGDAVH